jgi:hypothetical protein
VIAECGSRNADWILDWGLSIGDLDWGFGLGIAVVNPQSPINDPQSNPQSAFRDPQYGEVSNGD